MPNTQELLALKCTHTETALTHGDINDYLTALSGWSEIDNHIVKNFKFKNYYETTAFFNAITYVFHAEDHHPEITLTYSNCIIKFDTHSVNGGKGGLSLNDFICAAKVDAIYQQSFS
ncbi:MAG: 4a-hydroxytetrahydrobiopterin dehydratase [Solimicrobium sp.]|jgi:4a-hydroxytetrahydrobiopterin dehydratase|nr:4a-hydroxytetrahydrobiopterin dehydratase [Solimicrobium sp.]